MPAISSEIPAIGTYRFVLRYNNDDIGCEYPIVCSSYEETVETRAIRCEFDGRTTHTLFIKQENSKDEMHASLPGWVDVTEEFLKEVGAKAMVESLHDEDEPAEAVGSEVSVLRAVQDNPKAGKRALIEAAGITDDEWLPAIRSLVERGLVKKSGIAKYTTYRAVDG